MPARFPVFKCWSRTSPAGLPGLNIPIGFDSNHMPIGMQIIANAFEEAKIYHLASFIEKELSLKLDPKGGEHNE